MREAYSCHAKNAWLTEKRDFFMTMLITKWATKGEWKATCLFCTSAGGGDGLSSGEEGIPDGKGG